MENCGHYTRGCKFVSPCCNEITPCRFCHDDSHDHQINRYDVQIIQCNRCNKQQGISNQCVDCGHVFADYFCNICRLYDSHPTNKYFHCDECGMCRVGNREDIFHCSECNMCFDNKYKETHSCKKDLFRTDCCICLNDLFSSRQSSVVMNCGHAIHQECSNEWVKKNIGCPLCRKTMFDSEWAKKYSDYKDQLKELMPYEGLHTVKILCNDCNQSNEVSYHPIGNKCPNCNSYNTH